MKIAKELSKVYASIVEGIGKIPYTSPEGFEEDDIHAVRPEDFNYDDLDDTCPECGARIDEPVGNPPKYNCTDCGWTGEHPNRT